MDLASRSVGALAVAAAALLGACGDDDAVATPGGSVLATTTVWADIATHVACGEQIDSVIPAGVDPHTYEPSLRDRERLGDAGLVIANGADLEESVLGLLDAVAADGTRVVEMADSVELLDDLHHADDHTHGDDHDDDHGDEHDDDERAHGNPHFWLDPVRVAETVDALESALLEVGGDEADITRCADDYRDELQELDAEITAAVARIPASDRLLVTNHDELGYFAERYGFEVLGTVLPSSSTVAESDAATLEALSETIEARRIAAIFVETSERSADAAALADRIGIPVVPLVTASLTDDGETATYVGMLRVLADAIVGALEP